jgi:hypothetical protein
MSKIGACSDFFLSEIGNYLYFRLMVKSVLSLAKSYLTNANIILPLPLSTTAILFYQCLYVFTNATMFHQCSMSDQCPILDYYQHVSPLLICFTTVLPIKYVSQLSICFSNAIKLYQCPMFHHFQHVLLLLTCFTTDEMFYHCFKNTLSFTIATMFQQCHFVVPLPYDSPLAICFTSTNMFTTA